MLLKDKRILLLCLFGDLTAVTLFELALQHVCVFYFCFSHQGLSLPRSIKIVVDFCPFLVKPVMWHLLSGGRTGRGGSWDHCTQAKEEISN